MKYIDISEWQDIVDWDKLREQYDAGTLSGVIIRAGHGQKLDIYWNRNIAEANRVGIPVGAFWFCEARTVAMAKAEAETFIKTIAPHRIELPVAYDFEEWTVENCIKPYGVTPSKALITAMCDAACSTLEEAGYYTMIYTNPNCMTKYQDMGVLGRYDLWLADWDLKEPSRACGIWQWGGSKIDGITPGVDVDTNEAYKDYAKIIRDAGLNLLNEEICEDCMIEQPKKWYDDAMAWAKENGIMSDGRPDDAATRAEVAQMFYNLDKRFSGLLSDE